MDLKELALPGVFLITPTRHMDARGYFAELYRHELFAEKGMPATFVQDSVSYSKKGVIRGLHFQKPPHTQAKLVRCSSGRIMDVAADITPGSPTYGRFAAAELSGEEQNMLYIPEGYAHGFCVLSDEGATVEYKLSNLYDAENAIGIAYDDPTLAIPWPVKDPILSDKDRSWPRLSK